MTHRAFAPLVAAICLLSVAAGAQVTPQAATQEEARQEKSNRLTFGVAVESVTLDVVVVDGRGRFVPGLAQDDFVILDGGAPQQIEFFTAEFTPVTTMLLLDSSSSIRSNADACQSA